MPSFAACTFLGYLGRDPETRTTSGDGSVTSFSVAVTRSTTVAGERREETTWWKVSIWGTRGKTAAQYLRKGSLVIVSGWPVVREYRDRDGVQRFSCELLDATWGFAESRAAAATAQNAQSPDSAAAPQPDEPPASPRPPAAAGDDEPPF